MVEQSAIDALLARARAVLDRVEPGRLDEELAAGVGRSGDKGRGVVEFFLIGRNKLSVAGVREVRRMAEKSVVPGG